MVEQVRFALSEGVSREVISGGRTFDPENIFFMGHSQGGLNGPLFLAIDDHTRGGVLSGAGGHLPIALVDKVQPLNIPTIVITLLRIRDTELEHLVYEHPVYAALQTWTEVADPTNYGHFLFHQPRPGFAPKHILQTEGITDQYTPPRAIEALALAARIPVLGEVLTPIDGASVLGIDPQTRPASGNMPSGVTAGLLQFSGGHFVAFDDGPHATIDAFFHSLVRAGVPPIA